MRDGLSLKVYLQSQQQSEQQLVLLVQTSAGVAEHLDQPTGHKWDCTVVKGSVFMVSLLSLTWKVRKWMMFPMRLDMI